MKVVLCEDNEKILMQIANYIENYAMMEDNSIEIVLKADQPTNVLSYIQSNRADCYFLDIDLGSEITGMDLARQIRTLDPISSIIFVTTHSEMLRLTFAYRIEALDFIIKDDFLDLQDNVLAALKTAYNKYIKIGTHAETRYYPLKIGEFVKNIEFQNLLFFKASAVAHKITLHTVQGKFEFYESLNILEKFDKSFFRIHRAYVVNVGNISEIDKKQRCVIMKNGEICPVAFRRLKLLEKALFELSNA